MDLFNNFKFDDIEKAIEDYKNGKPVIVADDEDRENEGDLICSAQMATPEIINFMAKECRGLICLAIDSTIAERLELPQMVKNNTEGMKTAFTLSIDGAEKYGVTTFFSNINNEDEGYHLRNIYIGSDVNIPNEK